MLNFRSPRQLALLCALTCFGALVYGLYLQHVVGLVPCPMCVVQRYAIVLAGVWAAVAASSKRPGVQIGFAVLGALSALGGAITAARQSLLQWYPPEETSCTLDIYGMIENLPLKRALPMIFEGTGECSKVDWQFLGLTIANWSFLLCCAVLSALLWAAWLARSSRRV